MQQQHQVPSSSAETTQRVFTPEEAGEIIRRASHLQDSRFTFDQLLAIAEEAGVSREALLQAIQETETDKAKQELENMARQRKRRRRLWLAGTCLSLLFCIGLFTPVFMDSQPIGSASDGQVRIPYEWLYEGPLWHDNQLWYSTPPFASSGNLNVYVIKNQSAFENSSSLARERVDIVQVDETNRYSVQNRVRVGKDFGKVSMVSIAPNLEWIAIYDALSQELWVVRRDGTSLRRIVSGSKLLDGSGRWVAVSPDNPFIGWEQSKSGTVILIQTEHDGIARVDLDRLTEGKGAY